MGLKKYFKRFIDYILFEHKPKIVNVSVNEKNDYNDFKGKIVIVTGGSDGIGFEIANKFSKLNANVIITGRNEEKLLKSSKKINCDYFVNDIRNLETQDEMLKKIIDKYGKIDILVNNAGISKHEKDFFDVTPEGFDDQFEINLRGAYFITQKVIKQALSNNNALNVIFISSERGSQSDYLPYGLTKNAMNCLVEGLAARFIKDNIRINAIAPGVTASNIFKVDKTGDLGTNNYFSGRFFIPEEVAEIVAFICSDSAKCISGEIIHTNNGNHLNTWFKQ